MISCEMHSAALEFKEKTYILRSQNTVEFDLLSTDVFIFRCEICYIWNVVHNMHVGYMLNSTDQAKKRRMKII